MQAVNLIESILGLILCGFGLYVLLAKKPVQQVNLEAGGVKLTVNNAGALLLILGVILLALSRISAMVWKDFEIQFTEAKARADSLASRTHELDDDLASANGQLAELGVVLGRGGPARFAVPDMVGLPHDRAVALIRQSGLDTLGISWITPARAVQALEGRGYRELSPGVMAKGGDTLRLAPGEVVLQAVMPGARLPKDSRVLLAAVEIKGL
jgi:hypothetical protein